MNRIPYILVLLAILVLFPQCEKPLEYKFTSRPFQLNCTTTNKDLLKEALYSFQDDISKYYNDPDIILGTKSAYMYSYRQFIFRGFDGVAPFAEIASPHTLEVLEKLKKVDGLWDRNREGTNLNYTGELMSCIFENIKDEELKTRFSSLLKVDYLTPKIMAEPMRQQVGKVFNDEHLATYIALDAYYQYLLDLPTKND